jgi:hypothetical protein
MPESPKEMAARIAERNRVDAYMKQKLTERREAAQPHNHPAVQKLANDLASHKDIQQAMTDQLAKHPAVQAAAMQHVDKKGGVPDDAAANLRQSLVKQFAPAPVAQGINALQNALGGQPQQQQPPQPQDQGQQ